MFNFLKKKKKPVAPTPEPGPEPEIPIYTMPKRFLKATHTPTAPKSARLMGIAIMILATGGIIVGAVILFKMSFQKSAPEAINVALVTNQEVQPEIPANLNENVNESLAVNENRNANLNLNLNENVNVNENINLNLNANLNVNVAPPTPPKTGVDFDQDGLTDQEEKLYNTDPRKPDTDEDGYPDSEEVLNLYSPLGLNKLKEAGLVKIYSGLLWSIFYPHSWQVSVEAEANEVIFAPVEKGEFVEVIVEANSEKDTVIDWYLKQSPGLSADVLAEFSTDSLEGIRTPDELTVYLVKKGSRDPIYLITHNIGTKRQQDFKTTFEMMIKSFKVIE